MRREQLTLVMLASAKGESFTPVQIQKAMFLLSRESPGLFDGNSRYNFTPFDYGPFDKAVYDDLEAARGAGMVAMTYGRVRRYSATPHAVAEYSKMLEQLPANEKDFIERVSSFVRRLSFADLVTAIYKAYPEMKEKSVFVGA